MNIDARDREVFVLAAGKAHRFFNVPKQLLKVKNTTLLGRIEEQVHARHGFYPITVTHNEAIAFCASRPFKPACNYTTCNSAMSTSHLWREWNIILLGDVWYTDKLMDEIFSFDGNLAVFGNVWEIFGMAFHICQAERVIDALLNGSLYGTDLTKETVGGKLRFAYRHLVGHAMDCIDTPGVPPDPMIFHYVTDETMDVDTPQEYDNLLRMIGDVK